MKVFKILDLYIIRKFLGSYFFSIVLILAITIVFDTNEKLDAFMKAPLRSIIFDYFLNFLPYFANLFSPLFTFIAVIFFTSKLADNSEIIAILSSGVSFKRLFIPYMFSAAVIAAIMIAKVMVFIISCNYTAAKVVLIPEPYITIIAASTCIFAVCLSSRSLSPVLGGAYPQMLLHITAEIGR